MEEMPLLPVRRIHNYAYCSRLFYFQWVENIFEENADTVTGSHFHRNVDATQTLKSSLQQELKAGANLRSLHLSSNTLQITGIVDLLENSSDGLCLIDYKKGSAQRDDSGFRIAKYADAIQLAAYSLLLDEQGITPNKTQIYYGEDRRRVDVEINETLISQCRSIIEQARNLAKKNIFPPALHGDPRCLYCSAYPVCLPNESLFWAAKDNDSTKNLPIKQAPRPDDGEEEIIVVQQMGSQVGIRGGKFVISVKGTKLGSKPTQQVRAFYLYGAVQMTAQATHTCLENGIEVAYFSPAGRFIGMLTSFPSSSVDARRGQYRLFEQSSIRMDIAKNCIVAKIQNQRTLLMRNGQVEKSILFDLSARIIQAKSAESIPQLMGIEGEAASIYFSQLQTMLKPQDWTFQFDGRKRRPPPDPINALLSMGYSMLSKEIAGVLFAVGLDPNLGFMHQPRYGRPALALDMMEEFRPLIADSVVISLINRREVDEKDFIFSTKGCFLNECGRRAFWQAWSRRLDTNITHPVFGYSMSYRRMFEVQARQLWRYLRGEALTYHGFTTR